MKVVRAGERLEARAWLYVAIVGVGYMVSRGLAKAGTPDPYWANKADELRDMDGH
jgi:hypothetical protein